ncbi:calcium-binding and coiled-coil domain-containing protein 2 isoform X2 [Psammomys obesus]|uniref:calcium-binding and coiled-coil domain-containing protein 2 isoform X2 n=1 Tax=Psammomys obesus TaxID=48139 RepID=UPI002452CC2F|nr:calcium-binding and coiled-coil domain-containing protein 2 isoform X2 [Psammomys obesus]
MENTMGDPPISAVLLDHCTFSQVHFNSVEKFYVPGGDVMCYYVFTPQFTPHRKDWIGIFKVGWKTTREYYTFMWVAVPDDLNKESSKQQEVKFKAYYLPKDDEHYQFCYVDLNGVVRGASIPFQFRAETENDIVVVTTKERVEEIEQLNEELYQENQTLKGTCASLQEMLSEAQAELQKKQEALQALDCSYKSLEQDVEEQKVCWENELLQLKEYNQKIASEKETIELQVEKLQTQLSSKDSELEKLAQHDKERTRQLEWFKQVNWEYRTQITEQRKKLERIQERMKEEETASRKKDELLRKKEEHLQDEVSDLKRRLHRCKMDNQVLCKEKEKLEKGISNLEREKSKLSLLIRQPSVQGAAENNSGLFYGDPYIEDRRKQNLYCLKM